MAVFLMVGCQTTDTTPKDVSSPAKVEKTQKEEKEQPELVLPRAMVVSKPVLCGDATTVLEGVVSTHKEKPIAWWNDGTYGHKVLLVANRETGTMTVLEYPSKKGDLSCFLSVGENFTLSEDIGTEKTKGNPVLYKKVLD